jgi:ATP-dependent helicase/nuclease subunit A
VLKTPPATVALGLLWPEPTVSDAFARRFAEVGTIDGEPELQIPRDPILSRLPAAWSLPPVAASPVVATPLGRRSVGPVAIEFDWAGETARHIGTVVHRELQRLSRAQRLDLPDAQQLVQLQARLVAELAELGVPLDRRQTAAMRALEAVQRTLADERGRWLLAGTHIDAHSEFALTGVLAGDLVNIVIDRTFVDHTGVRWIVDYKTSAHEGAGLDEFLTREQARYAPQLQRYAALMRALRPEPIRLGLYFPLLSAWREWAPDQWISERTADAEGAPA